MDRRIIWDPTVTRARVVDRSFALSRIVPSLWYGILAVGIASPLFRSGYLLLLDFALVRRVPVHWGQAPDAFAPANKAPIEFFFSILVKLGYAAGPLLLFALFFMMGIGAHRAFQTLAAARSFPAAYFAGTLYVCNPFVYERLVNGQIYFLIAYALAPLVLLSIYRLAKQQSPQTILTSALLITGVAWTSFHFLAMLPLFLVGFFALDRIVWNRGFVKALLFVVLLVILTNLWWLVDIFRSPPGLLVDSRDLNLYTTQPHSNAVLGNVTALYGFWRHEFRLPKDGVRAWWLLAIAMMIPVTRGLVSSLRTHNRRLPTVGILLTMAASVLLASGVSFGPTSGMYRWAFDTIPGFKAFREPQKWAAFLPLSYAFLGAVGLDRVAFDRTEAQSRSSFLLSLKVLVVALPLVYAWTLVWNWEQLKTVRFPEDWYRVASTIRARGGGRALVLPWHQFSTYRFSHHHVTNPAPFFFLTPVLSGDNVEIGPVYTQSRNPQSQRIESVLFDRQPSRRLPGLMADLCLDWVVLVRDSDYQTYQWLYSVDSLQMVWNGQNLIAWRNAVRSPNECDSGASL